jgi:hypothetical protein
MIRGVEADFAVELAIDDESLDFPWASPDNGPRYYDLKSHPEHLENIQEAQQTPELARFLRSINASKAFETAKCDAWFSEHLSPEEDVFAASCKFCSYVDVLFCNESRFSFSDHEQFVTELTKLLKRAPEISAAAEFLVRRCHYKLGDGVRGGFYITFYLFGFGKHQEQAQQFWAIGLKTVEHAMRQVAGYGAEN